MTARRTLTTRPAPSLERGDDWRDMAACHDKPDLFYPPGVSWHGHKKQARAALLTCHDCPVKTQCLNAALNAPFDPFAILGGTTPEQRKHLAATKRRPLTCDQCHREFPSAASLGGHMKTHSPAQRKKPAA